MDFARKQLEKYGWKDGKGLGKNENGIAEALKPKLKFDNAGIGHNLGDQFTDNWWERVFNNAAKNINVKSDEQEVKLELNDEPVEISTKNYSLKDLKKNNNFEYGNFLKTAKITKSGIESYNVVAPEPLAPFTSLTDDELFAACGGRTAHKGARHGLKLSGKLHRIEKQEKLLLKKMKNVSLTDDVNNIEKKIKKLKKHKEEAISDAAPQSEISNSNPKKGKSKRKSVSFNEETTVKYYTPDSDLGHESNKDENSNNPVVIDPNSNLSDEGIEQDIDENNSEWNDSHKSFEEAQRSFDDLSKAEKKKLKKRKLKKKTATSLFIEEVRHQMFFDESSKKRKLVNDDIDIETKQRFKCKYSKKQKYVPEECKEITKEHRKKMKSIVKSLDSFCKISDDE